MQRRRPGRARRALLLHLLFFFFFFAAAAAACADDADAPEILATVCGTTPAADPEAFDVSFVSTLEMIYQNVTRDGFGAASTVSGINTVYGLGQCVAYLYPTDCQLCFAQSRVKLPHCLPATGGRIYLDGCFLRYGPDNFAVASNTAVCCNARRTRRAGVRGRRGGTGAERHGGRARREGLRPIRVGGSRRGRTGGTGCVRRGAVLEVAQRQRVRYVSGERARPGGPPVPAGRRRGVRPQRRVHLQVLDAAVLLVVERR